MTVKEKLVELLREAPYNIFGNKLGNRFFNSCLELIADYLISHGGTVQEWFSVEDKLPNCFEHVLINVPGDKPFTTVHEAYLRKDGLWDVGLYRYGKEDVTRWSYLPQPPKENEDEPTTNH